jgi:hypothetical protein
MYALRNKHTSFLAMVCRYSSITLIGSDGDTVWTTYNLDSAKRVLECDADEGVNTSSYRRPAWEEEFNPKDWEIVKLMEVTV